jgi:hypothetical protein
MVLRNRLQKLDHVMLEARFVLLTILHEFFDSDGMTEDRKIDRRWL